MLWHNVTMITRVTIYEGDTLYTGITLALTHHLYIPGWCLKPSLEAAARDPLSEGRLALLRIDNTPVALAWVIYGQVMAFCLESYRRRGFASKCVEALNLPPGIEADLGIKGSDHFWGHCKVPLMANCP